MAPVKQKLQGMQLELSRVLELGCADSASHIMETKVRLKQDIEPWLPTEPLPLKQLYAPRDGAGKARVEMAQSHRRGQSEKAGQILPPTQQHCRAQGCPIL